MVPSLAVTEMRTGRRRSAAPHRIELGLLVLALVCFVAAVVIGLIPVDNPGVQSCGSPIGFVWTNPNDVVLPAPGLGRRPAQRGRPAGPAALPRAHRRPPAHHRLAWWWPPWSWA